MPKPAEMRDNEFKPTIFNKIEEQIEARGIDPGSIFQLHVGDTWFDLPEEVKSERLTNLVGIQRKINYAKNQLHLGETFEVLVEGPAKKPGQLMGRNDGNKIVVFPDSGQKVGDFVDVRIEEVTPNTLIGGNVKFV